MALRMPVHCGISRSNVPVLNVVFMKPLVRAYSNQAKVGAKAKKIKEQSKQIDTHQRHFLHQPSLGVNRP